MTVVAKHWTRSGDAGKRPCKLSSLLPSQVRSALSRPQKEATVTKLKESLDSSAAVFGLRYNKVSVSNPLAHPALWGKGFAICEWALALVSLC